MKLAVVGSTAQSMVNFRTLLISELVAQGAEVYCYAIDYDSDTEALVASLGAVPVKYKLSRSSLNPVLLVSEIARLVVDFRTRRIDTVFSFFAKPTVVATIAGWFAGVSSRIVMLEGMGSSFVQHSTISSKVRLVRRVQSLLYSLSYVLARNVIVLNDDDAKDLSRVTNRWVSRKISVIPGIGVDLSKFTYQPLSEVLDLRFIFVGRLIAEKGIYEFVDASLKLLNLYPLCEIYVVGDIDADNPSSLKEKEVQKLNSDSKISFLGYRTDIKELLARSHVLVLPSYREGFPCAVMEAMAIGRPVLASNVPGCRAAIKHGDTGMLTEAHNATKLLEKMLWFVVNKAELPEMSKRCRTYAEIHFDGFKLAKLISATITGKAKER